MCSCQNKFFGRAINGFIGKKTDDFTDDLFIQRSENWTTSEKQAQVYCGLKPNITVTSGLTNVCIYVTFPLSRLQIHWHHVKHFCFIKTDCLKLIFSTHLTSTLEHSVYATDCTCNVITAGIALCWFLTLLCAFKERYSVYSLGKVVSGTVPTGVYC